jgi:hypothetical protein
MANKSQLENMVGNVMNEHDPEGLLKMGCPKDEYDPEITEIAAAIHLTMGVNEIWIIVCNTLHWYFGDHSLPVLYWNKHRDIAADIVKRLPAISDPPSATSGKLQEEGKKS